MRTPFDRTLAFIDAEQRGPFGRLSLAAALLIALWVAWLAIAKTKVYAVSDEGRLLAAGGASPLQAPIAGVVVSNDLALEREVHAGEVLVVLDSSAERLRKVEEETRMRSLEQAVTSVELILGAERGLAEASARAGASRVASAATRTHVAAEVAVLMRQQDEAMRRLRAASLATGLETLKTAEDMQRQRGQLRISGAETLLASADLERSRKETEVRLLGLSRDLADLRGRIEASHSVLAQLDWEVARRSLRAPVDGVVADVLVAPSGASVAPNQLLATIIPHAKMRWVAYFPPREAVGRIRAGQKARIRLDAFPWTAYGAVDARVVSVGSEPRDQRVRVELEVGQDNTAIPLSHGMTGVTDVEVETLSPMRLLLRLIGQGAQGGGAPPRGTTASPSAVVAERR